MRDITLTSPEGWTRHAGYINHERNAFIVNKEYNKHYFRNYHGIGFNLKLVRALSEQQIKKVWVFLKKDDETLFLRTTPATIFQYGIEFKNPKDFKDLQLILPIKYFMGDVFED